MSWLPLALQRYNSHGIRGGIRVDYHDPNYERHYLMSDFLDCNGAPFYVGKYSSLDSDHYGDC